MEEGRRPTHPYRRWPTDDKYIHCFSDSPTSLPRKRKNLSCKHSSSHPTLSLLGDTLIPLFLFEKILPSYSFGLRKYYHPFQDCNLDYFFCKNLLMSFFCSSLILWLLFLVHSPSRADTRTTRSESALIPCATQKLKLLGGRP